MTRTELEARSAKRGFSLHASCSEDRVSRMNPSIMLGHAVRPNDLRMLNRIGLNIADGDQLAARGCVVLPGRIGNVGGEVVAPPIADKELMLVIMPSYTVVRHLDGAGESYNEDEDESRPIRMTYTILAPR